MSTTMVGKPATDWGWYRRLAKVPAHMTLVFLNGHQILFEPISDNAETITKRREAFSHRLVERAKKASGK